MNWMQRTRDIQTLERKTETQVERGIGDREIQKLGDFYVVVKSSVSVSRQFALILLVLSDVACHYVFHYHQSVMSITTGAHAT